MANWTTYHKFLALLLIITGSLNTLSVKWADYIESKGSDGNKRTFHHPFVQSAAMFMGEMLCLLTFKVLQYSSRNTNALTQGNQHINPFILMPAAMFDLVGTSIMYIGLILTYPSSFQMLRGSIIIFVAVLSMTFLNKKIIRREWVGIVNVILGLTVVGITDALYLSPEESKGRNSLITGDLLIILAQVISACQMVYEEKFVSGLNIPPLQAVGWEGVFGFSVLSVLLVIFYWIPAPPHFAPYPGGPVEDAIDGLVQIVNSPWLFISILGNMISIAFFNFAGISVTKEMSATTRMVLDSIRTIVIWIVSIGLKWQKFHWPHLIGFALLILGTCAYNGIIPNYRRANLDSSDYPDDEILTADDSEDNVANEAEPTPDEGQDQTSKGIPV